MAKGRRSSITSEERNRWLNELEKGNGNGITRIAATARHDIRTVKKHIETARSERYVKQARHDFLLGRLELHNEDILGEVRRMRNVLVSLVRPHIATMLCQ